MTEQGLEIFVLKGEVLYTKTLPLVSYLQQRKDVRLHQPWSTGYYRGYQGTWELKEDKLFIVDFRSGNYSFHEMFNTTKPVHAKWFTGIIELQIDEQDWSGTSFINHYLELDIKDGEVKSKKIVIRKFEKQAFTFGKYYGLYIDEVMYGLKDERELKVAYRYIENITGGLLLNNCDIDKFIPVLCLIADDEDMELFKLLKTCALNYLITKDFVAITPKNLDDDYNDRIAIAVSTFLEKLLKSNFHNQLPYIFSLLKVANVTNNLLLINGDLEYVIWAINNVEQFSILPSILENSTYIRKLRTINVNRLSSNIFKFEPVFETEHISIPDEIKLLNREKYKQLYGLIYVSEKGYFLKDWEKDELVKLYGYYLDDKCDFKDTTYSTDTDGTRYIYADYFEDPNSGLETDWKFWNEDLDYDQQDPRFWNQF